MVKNIIQCDKSKFKKMGFKKVKIRKITHEIHSHDYIYFL